MSPSHRPPRANRPQHRQQPSAARRRVAGTAIGILLMGFAWLPARAQEAPAVEFDDHQNMMDQLGLKTLRPGADPNNQDVFDEATANPYADTMPDVLTMNDGTKVTTPEQWPARRAEIVEAFEREVYGRIPANVPAVRWEVTEEKRGEVDGIPTITRELIGRVDNAAHPQIEVTIEASFTVPANATEPVPMMISFDTAFWRFFQRMRQQREQQRAATQPVAAAAAAAAPSTAPALPEPAWHAIALAHGWGYGSITPNSIQPDNNQFTTAGIIGLTNKGQPRTPEQWGALRAWGWGVSRMIDAFEQNPDWMVDPGQVGVEGVSRYGKAALVAQAFDERVAVGIPASSGQGGTKLHRHIFGEAVENLTGGGGYHWMAGNYLKYGAEEPVRKTAADLPVDSHQLIALCAPRPCFISYGVVEKGDAKWVDARGSFMAGVLASPVYELLGKGGFGVTEDYITAPMPPVGQLVGGELAWRQHDGGHEVTPNWQPFFDWVGQYIDAPPPPQQQQPSSRADRPEPRADANSRLAHEQLVAKAQQGRIDVYFLGDSITRRWGCTDPQYAPLLAHWNDSFLGWNAANFGWGGDRTQNILWRIENGELDGVNPKVIVLQAGTNNVGGDPGDDAQAAEITRGIEAIIATCREKAPAATIIVTGIFPRNDNIAAMPTIIRINANLAALADGGRVRYLDINDKLADADGRLFDGMMEPDQLHPTIRAYEVWADALGPILHELLGPPSDHDLAPPPTGDPSARHAAG